MGIIKTVISVCDYTFMCISINATSTYMYYSIDMRWDQCGISIWVSI